jgi:superfamily II RNA helicase
MRATSSWKIAIEELMRWASRCVFAPDISRRFSGARRDHQSSIRKARDFMDLTIGEVQQIAGRAGRRGKDYVGFAVVTPSPYIDLEVLTKGFTGNPEAIDSQFTISYPMVLNLLKAHPHEQIQAILAKSFAQFQLNQRANVLEGKLDVLHTQMEPFGPRVCTDWITQWHTFDQARRQKPHRHQIARHESPEVTARFHFMTPGRVVGLSKGRGIVLRQYRSKGQKSPMVTVLRAGGAVTESPAGIVTDVFDRLFECTEQQGYPWCTPESFDELLYQLTELPTRLPLLPILVSKQSELIPDAIVQSLGDFPCPTCSSRPACQKDYIVASRLRQEQQRHIKSIQALRTSLWHRFQERIEVLQQFGYLSPTSHLTDDGEWARLIRIDHSLLITELIRAEAFAGADPAVLTGVMASIAHDDDRPGAFPRVSTGLSSLLGQVRKLAESLSPYEDPPVLRADIAAVAERWVSDPSLTWIGLCRSTTMAEGDIYRLLARTLEFLSQLHTLRSTHPGLADSASQAIALIRRGVLEELP